MSTDLSVLQQTFLFRLSTLISFSFPHYPFPLTFPRYLSLTAFSFLLCPSHFPRHSVIIPLLLLVVLHHFPLFSSRIIIFSISSLPLMLLDHIFLIFSPNISFSFSFLLRPLQYPNSQNFAFRI
jgi:hypothetical protein